MTAGRPQPRETLERCALRAQLRGDQMLGTAFPAARLLLVEQPGPWGQAGLRTSRFDHDIAVALEERGRAEGVRVQTIRRPGRSPQRAQRRWAYVDTRAGTPVSRWGSFTDDAELLNVPFDESAGEPDPAPLYLVCAHPKHDACCALRGRPVAAALAAIRPGRVWETSHVGGDRFASNVLVLPLGLMYGRVLPFAAAEFVAAAEDGEVIGALLRGRIGVPPAAQAAIGFAHDHLALPRYRDIELVSSEVVDNATVVVRISSPHGLLDVTVRRERVDAAGLTCGFPQQSWFIAHRPVSIRPATT